MRFAKSLGGQASYCRPLGLQQCVGGNCCAKPDIGDFVGFEWCVPIQTPMIDLRAIGASGGSIASINNRGDVARWPSYCRPEPDTVGEQMGQVMKAVVDDSFRGGTLFQRTSHRFITEVREGVVPAARLRANAHRVYRHDAAEVLRDF